jgi:hypothetical protein
MKHDSSRAARQLERDVIRQRLAARRLKKDAVLHLRIEGTVMARIKAEAEARAMSVSDLVRNYLVERYSEPRPCDGAPGFLLATTAFSDVELNQDTHCAICDEIMLRGTRARLAHGPSPPERLVCTHCYESLQSQTEDHAAPAPGDE